MSLFSESEIAYLRDHWIGRLATSGRSGRPHVVPTVYRFDVEQGTIKIGAHPLEGRGQERLYVRHLRGNPRAAFVVDDMEITPAWRPSGLTIKGAARLHAQGGEALGVGYGPHWVEIVPDWVSSWGVDTGSMEPAVPRRR